MEQNLLVSTIGLPADFFERLQGTLRLKGEQTSEGIVRALLKQIDNGTIQIVSAISNSWMVSRTKTELKALLTLLPRCARTNPRREVGFRRSHRRCSPNSKPTRRTRA